MRDLELQLRAYGAVLDDARSSVVETVDARPLRARRSLIVAAVAGVVVAIAASVIAVGATRSGDTHRPHVVTPSVPVPTVGSTLVTKSAPTHLVVTAIGDSVMEGAEGALRRAIPGVTVDAAVSRQFHQAIQLVEVYAGAGKLPATVVIDLGTNGRATSAELDEIMRAAGNRRVYFVTVRVPRLWENEVNTELRALPGRWPNAHVVDWHDYANAHGDWFVQDGFHLTVAGQRAYAEFIARALRIPRP